MYLYLKNLYQFMWLLITDKCRIINILPRMPEMRNNSHALLHTNEIFIDYNRTRYIKTEAVVGMIIESQATQDNTIFKKLREKSEIKKFTSQGTFNSTCGICIEKMKMNDIVREMTCKHSFHIDCIDQWFEKKCTCPYCNIVF